MHISNRLLKVLKYLEQNNSTYIRSISKELDISERVVRYDIDTLNYLFKLNSLSKIEKGAKGRLKFNSELIGSPKLKELHQIKKSSKQERIDLIKAKLLIEGKLNLTLLTDELGVSRTSIRKDLQEVTVELKRNGIESNSNSLLETDEEKIRNTFLRLYGNKLQKFILKEESLEERSLVDLYLLSYFEELDLERVKKSIKSFINKNAKKRHYIEIFLYVLATYLRVTNGNYLKNKKDRKNVVEVNDLDLERFLDEIEGSLGVNLGVVEKKEFKGFLIGILNPDQNKDIIKNWFEIVLVIKKLIRQVASQLSIDIDKDKMLLDGLLEHLKSTIIRLKHKGGMEHNIYTEVIGPYPELFKSFKELLKPLEKILKLKLPSSEVTLIIIHFLAALERNNDKKNRRVLLVCGGGYGTSKLIAKRIVDIYNVEIIGNIHYTEFKEYDLRNIDVVITTLNIKGEENKSIPLLKVSPLMTSLDKEKLNDYLFEKSYDSDKLHEILKIINENAEIKDENKLVEKLEKSLHVKLDNPPKSLSEYRLIDWVNQEKIKILEGVEGWEDAIRESGNILKNTGDIEGEYTEKIIEIGREVGVHYLLENGVAIPHGEVGNHVNNSSIGILIVKNGVALPDKKETKIFFMIAANGTKDHVRSIEEILSFSKDKGQVKEVLKAKNESEVYEILNKISFK